MKISKNSCTPNNAAMVNGPTTTGSNSSPSERSAAAPTSTTLVAVSVPPAANNGTLTLASTSGMDQQLGTPPTANTGANQPARVSPPTDANTDVASGSTSSISGVVASNNTTNVARPPSIVRRIEGGEVTRNHEEVERKDERDNSGEDDRKPAAKVTNRQKRSHDASPTDDKEEDDVGANKSPTKKLRSDLSDLSVSEDSNADIDTLISTGLIPGPTHASLPGTSPSLRFGTRETVWQPTKYSRSSRRQGRAANVKASAHKTIRKARKGQKTKPQPLPKNQEHALKLIADKEKAIKGLSTKNRKKDRKAILLARLSDHAKTIFNDSSKVSSYGGQQTNFGYQLYRLMRPELTFAENDVLNWEDIELLSDQFYNLSGGVSMEDLEALYQAEKKKEEES